MIATESGHWYDSSGQPAYTYINAKGEEKPTTLRQARKNNLFPSVTTILKIKAQPGLEVWKRNQLLYAAATLPMNEGESVDDWCKRVVADSQEHGKEAADKGTAIHGAIERYFLCKTVPEEYTNEVRRVVGLLDKLGITPVAAEKSFAHPAGYGGKIDFIGIDPQGNPVVVDFKTQDFKGSRKKHYPEMAVQLAAYADGAGEPEARMLNIFISRNLDTPEVDYYEWTPAEIANGRRQFQLILELWQVEKNYRPTV